MRRVAIRIGIGLAPATAIVLRREREQHASMWDRRIVHFLFLRHFNGRKVVARYFLFVLAHVGRFLCRALLVARRVRSHLTVSD